MNSLAVLLNRIPLPCDDGWKRRTSAIIDRLHRQFDLRLIVSGPIDSATLALARDRWGSTIRIVCSSARPGRIRSAIRGLLRNEPYLVSAETTAEYQALLRAHASDCAIFAVTAALAQAAVSARVPGQIICDTHNIDSELLERYQQRFRNPIVRAYLRIAQRQMTRIERRLSTRVSEFWVCSDRELTVLQGRGFHSVRSVPNGVEMPAVARETYPSLWDGLVFFGHLEYQPNLDALEFLTSQILPVVREIYPKAHLRVYGAGNAEKARQIAATGTGISVEGRVDDITKVLMSSSCCVVPLRIGGGTRLKILEAMAHGLPVISTSIGAEGIRVTNKEHLLLANSPVEFLESLRMLAENPEAGIALADNAKRLIESNYTWDQTLSPAIQSIRERTRCTPSDLSTVPPHGR